MEMATADRPLLNLLERHRGDMDTSNIIHLLLEWIPRISVISDPQSAHFSALTIKASRNEVQRHLQREGSLPKD